MLFSFKSANDAVHKRQEIESEFIVAESDPPTDSQADQSTTISGFL
jgi:hypothetical protein